MKLRHIPVLAALAAAHTVAAVTLSTPNMAFEIAEDATAARFAFPKNTAGRDVMAGAPSPTMPGQLEELHIQVVLPEKQS